MGWKNWTVMAIFAMVIILVAACAGATDDRTGGSGTQPDVFADATHVTVYRNADQVPNVATFCLGHYGWAATLTTGDQGGNKPSTLVRFSEIDKTCVG
jgi:hypothetical protein